MCCFQLPSSLISAVLQALALQQIWEGRASAKKKSIVQQALVSQMTQLLHVRFCFSLPLPSVVDPRGCCVFCCSSLQQLQDLAQRCPRGSAFPTVTVRTASVHCHYARDYPSWCCLPFNHTHIHPLAFTLFSRGSSRHCKRCCRLCLLPVSQHR